MRRHRPAATRSTTGPDAAAPAAGGRSVVGGGGADDLRGTLLAEGWVERFSASGSRLEEVAAYYRSLGYEVRVELLGDAAVPGSCTECFAVPGGEGPVGLIFTRGAGAPALDDEDLFE